MKKWKVGLVGCGGIATWAHMPAYENLKDRAEIVACADIVFDKAQKFAEKYGIPHAYDSVEAMLANEPEIDYVDICVWTAAHAPVAITAAKAGKNILCEKPLAASLEQGLAMEKAVKEAGVKFMLAVVTRYGAEQQKFIELRDAGVFGDIYAAKTAYVRRRGTPGGWFVDKRYAGGGPVLDIGVHAIDRTWYLMGKPKPVSVTAETSYRIGKYEGGNTFAWNTDATGDYVHNTEDSAFIFFRFEDGKCMTADVSWVINGVETNTTTIYGSKAGCSFEPLTIYGVNSKGEYTDEKIEVEGNNFFEEEIRHYLDCLDNDKTPISTMDDAIVVQRMLDGIYRSAEEHKEILF